MSKNESGPCKDCIVYSMCNKLCDKADNYIKYTENRNINVDNWTWVMIGRDLNRQGRAKHYRSFGI